MYYLGSTTECLTSKRGQTKTMLRTVWIIVTLYIVINLD
jgi:preprotein translocase subunit SecG